MSWVAAAYPAAVKPLKVWSPRCAHSKILPAMIRRTRCVSLPAGRIKHARSIAISILDKVRESKLSLITANSLLPAAKNLDRNPNFCLFGTEHKTGLPAERDREYFPSSMLSRVCFTGIASPLSIGFEGGRPPNVKHTGGGFNRCADLLTNR